MAIKAKPGSAHKLKDEDKRQERSLQSTRAHDDDDQCLLWPPQRKKTQKEEGKSKSLVQQ